MGDRSSPDIVVGPRCHVQTAAQRFGAHALEEIKEFVWEPPFNNSSSSDDEMDQEEEGNDTTSGPDDEVGSNVTPDDDGQNEIDPGINHPRVPRVARTRSNLTVLSKRYNLRVKLYFAAYANKIYVYRPQRAPQILPPVSLVLRPPPSELGRRTRGALDRIFSHQMNYITVGDLGSLEILLMAYDDGDVVAYYTHLIVHAVEQGGSSMGSNVARTVPKPFFHENVGASAWGLAVHKQSRLIAASSNRHDVTVFALAMNTGRDRSFHSYQESHDPWLPRSALFKERSFMTRTRAWRLVLPIGNDGHNNAHNIPSITFCDDKQGHAEKIAAVDIYGNTWLLDIWRIGGSANLLKPTRNMVGHNPRSYIGWSILLLPDSSFRPAATNHAAMGLPANEILGLNSSTGDGIKNDVWLDITSSLCHVKDNAADPKTYLLQRHQGTYTHLLSQSGALGHPGSGYDFPDVDTPIPSDDDTDDDTPSSPAPEPRRLSPMSQLMRQNVSLNIRMHTISVDLEVELGFQLGLTIVPSLSRILQLSTVFQFLDFFAASSRREQQTRVVELRDARLPAHLTANFSLLRATTTGVELQSLDPKSASVLCRDVLPHHNHHRRGAAPWDLAPGISERVTMSLHVPELALVVLGSLNGRVALLGLTRPPRRHGFGPARPGGANKGVRVRRAFRVEAVLPRLAEERQRLRPWCALHGIAVSPAPDHRARGLALLPDGGGSTRTWRLMLHYIDHTILMYDISRHEEDGDLLII